MELDVPHTACVGQVRGLRAGPLVGFGKGLDGAQDLRTGMVAAEAVGLHVVLHAKACGHERMGELARKASWTGCCPFPTALGGSVGPRVRDRDTWPLGTGWAVLGATHSQAGKLERWPTGRSAAQLEAPAALAAWQAEGHWALEKRCQGTLSAKSKTTESAAALARRFAAGPTPLLTLACPGLGTLTKAAGGEAEQHSMAMLVSVALRPGEASPGASSAPAKPSEKLPSERTSPTITQRRPPKPRTASQPRLLHRQHAPFRQIRFKLRLSRLAGLPKSRQLLSLATVACTLQRDESRHHRGEEPDDSNVNHPMLRLQPCGRASLASAPDGALAGVLLAGLLLGAPGSTSSGPLTTGCCRRTSLHGNPKPSMPSPSRHRYSAIQDLPRCNNARHMCGPPRHREFSQSHLHLSCTQ